jgi:methanogenic corrinoid protein MtbC1
VEDLKRLRLIAEAVADGHRPSLAVRSDEPALRRLLTRQDAELHAAILDPLFAAVADLDTEGIRSRLQQAQKGRGLRDFLQHIVAPLLDRVGLAWADGTLDVQHEHLLTEVLEDFLRRMRLDLPPQPQRGSVLLATLPGERHRLGLLMVALLYAAAGVRVELLGIDLPVASIGHAARTLKVDRVAVSLSIQSAGETTRRLLMDLQDRLPAGCRLIIGGQGATRTRRVEGVERMAGLDIL